jgi:uncharacterized protein YcbK (DUF882 family)
VQKTRRKGRWLAAIAAVAAVATVRAGRCADPPHATPPEHEASSAPAHRFFLSGDGVLAIENAHTHEKIVVRYRDADGRYSADALDKIDALFRSRGDDEKTRVSLRLLEVIDYLEDHEHPKPLLLVSGYRSEGYNDALIAKGGQQARASLHSEGLAADLIFDGVDPHALWLKIRELDCCGAGYYKSNGFVHVDTGKPRFWEESTSRVKDNISKGNARLIARTDYDRYGDLVGLEITVHSITAHPLRVSNQATLVADADGAPLAQVKLVAPDVGATDEQGCIVADGRSPGAREVLRVAQVEPRGPAAPDASVARRDDRAVRARLVLTPCEPRLEETPEHVESNPIDVSAAALQARRRTSSGG